MIKILTVIGARPQFIKAAIFSVKAQQTKNIEEIIVHTGQHYDENMSAIFFEEMGIPKPHYHLQVGSGSHGAQTGKMLIEIEEVMLKEKPDAVLVYGDTNSTLAGALAAAKLHIPIAHVEAGLRSFDKKMPEEINRILTDQVSTWLFTPSQNAVQLLNKEGITHGVYEVGDIMYDAVLEFSEKAKSKSTILNQLKIRPKEYALATIHRQENTDNESNLRNILEAFKQIEDKIILPIHPRTNNKIAQSQIQIPQNVIVVEPLGYLDMMQLLANTKVALTDSGGLQKEAYYLHVPCITLRDTSEWVETIEAGWNELVGTNLEKIVNAYKNIEKISQKEHINLYGDGNTAQRIINILLQKT